MENERTNDKTKTTIKVIVACSILLIVLAVSYAFLPTDDLVNEPEDVAASTATLKLRYNDCASDTQEDCADISKDLAPGDSVTKTFEIKNVGTQDLEYDIYFRELTNTFLNDELVYTLENLTTGEIEVSDKPVPYGTNTNTLIKRKLTSKVGETTKFRLTITFLSTDYDQKENTNAEFSMKLGIKETSDTVTEKIIATSKGVRTEFDEPALTDEGVYSMEDDYGTSYYYRGAVENNYVKFGRNASGQDMYWRIVRINGDGSMRIMYSGTEAYANGTNNSDMFIGTSAFNTNRNDAKYVGYMYGPAGTTASTSKEEAQTNTESSTIKTYIDNWYKTNIVDTGYSDAVADIIFCNDRSTPGKTSTGWSDDTGLGYGTNATAYGATSRTGVYNSSTTSSAPAFKCSQKSDAFTVSDTSKGNGALTYPVGLITADEIVAAGSGKYNTTNTNYYLYRPSNWWWSLSPYNFNGSYSYVFHVTTSGQLSYHNVSSASAVAPVINLSAAHVENMVGDGTMESPYRTE